MANSIRLLRALADETRLRILNLLFRRELCVCQIMEVLGIGQSKASRHLAHLKNAGLVNDRREGLWMYYSPAAPHGQLHHKLAEWLALAEDEIPLAAKDLEALGTLGECGDLCGDRASSKGESSCEGAVAARS
jgi:ArsR family transcriptional regulator